MDLGALFHHIFGRKPTDDEQTKLDAVGPIYSPATAPSIHPGVPMQQAEMASTPGPVYSPTANTPNNIPPPLTGPQPDVPPPALLQGADQTTVLPDAATGNGVGGKAPGPVYDPLGGSIQSRLPDLGGPSVIYGAQGQPQGVTGGGAPLEQQQAYLDALEAYKPENHNSRFKSGLITGARSFLNGGGLPGAIEGFAGGLIDPAADERYQRNRDIEENTAGVNQKLAARAAASKTANEAVDRQYKQAEAERVLHPVYAPQVKKSDQGVVSISGTNATPVMGPKGQLQDIGEDNSKTAKPLLWHNPVTGKAETWSQNPDGTRKEKIGDGDIRDNLVKVDGTWVSQGAALNAKTTAQRQANVDTRENRRDTRQEQNRQQDRAEAQIEKETARHQKGGQVAGDLETNKSRMVEMDSRIKETQDRLATLGPRDSDQRDYLQKQLGYWQDERAKAVSQVAGNVSELQNNHADIYESGYDKNGYPYVKAKPFSTTAWKRKYPKASADDAAAAKENARQAGMTILD